MVSEVGLNIHLISPINALHKKQEYQNGPKAFYKITETMVLQNQSDILYTVCSQCEHMKLTEFIYSLFNDAVSSSDYVESSDRMINDN
jgi:hypothetical protein